MTEQKIKFEFTETEANIILVALANLPYKDSVNVITAIHAQAKEQLVQATPQAAVDVQEPVFTDIN